MTEEGERLRASTAAPLRQLELAVQYAGSPLARLERGMRIGMPETTVGCLAAPLIASLTTVFPRVSFAVTSASTDELVEAMLKAAVDVALINPVPDDRVFYRDLLTEELVVVGGPASDLNPTERSRSPSSSRCRSRSRAVPPASGISSKTPRCEPK